jgi:hypothetical protein
MPAPQHGLLVVEGAAIRSLVEIKGKMVSAARCFRGPLARQRRHVGDLGSFI